MRKWPLSVGQQQQQQHTFVNNVMFQKWNANLINPNERPKKFDERAYRSTEYRSASSRSKMPNSSVKPINDDPP